MSNTADPNHWVKSPPSTFVVVSGTSRDSINGSRGLVLQYDASKSRYLILLTISQQQVSLKADNLSAVSGIVDPAKAYWEMIRHSPDVQRQWRSVLSSVRQTTGMDFKYVLVGTVILSLVAMYWIGITKTLLLWSIVLLCVMIFGQDLLSSNLRTVVQNAPMRWKAFVRETIPSGHTIADNQMYLSAFTILVVVILFMPLFQSSKSTTTTPWSSGATSSITTPPFKEQRELYYKMGYDDAKANLDYGASLDTIDTTTESSLADEEWLPPVTKSSPFSISTAMAVFAIVRTVYPLGLSGGNGWDWRLAVSNVQALPAWRMGLLAFAVYRLVAAFV